jgi:glycosyltransferase involved in cell wall biosynthesis
MKLLVLIPAYNEEGIIDKTIRDIPKKIHGVDSIQILVVNDGSIDKTLEIAMNAGAEVVSHKRNMGVGSSFMTGIRNAVLRDADIVITLDADSQFNPKHIPELILPILQNQADVVVGSRFLEIKPTKMPIIKNFGNKVFSRLVSWCVGQHLTDTQTGFRAYSRESLLNISIVNEYTYTQEVLIDLKFKGFRIIEVPVSVQYDEKRKSRVVKSIFGYSYRALSIIMKTFVYHRPILAFSIIGIFLLGIGFLAKLITITKFGGLTISPGLSTGFIILGIVNLMMGLFANVVFKRQAFAEKDLRNYIDELNKKRRL